MALPEIRIAGDGMDITDAIRDYIQEKFDKYEKIFDLATGIDVVCVERVASRGVEKDFEVEMSMSLPKAVARVEKKGSDIYALVDEATDVLVRKVKRYKGKMRQWEGNESWKVLEMEDRTESVEDVEPEVIEYTPRIVRRIKMKDCSPMEEAEAIERMELSGGSSFLFKNKKTGNFSMVYREGDGSYGIVEPCE